jgi:O-antigen ligase
MRSGSRLPSAWFLLGVLVAVGFVSIAWAAQRRTGASSAPVIMLVIASAATMVAAALVGILHRALLPLVVALTISSVAVIWSEDLAGGPLSGPFGYRNAFGALLLQGAIAWLMAGFAMRVPAATALSLLPAGALGALAIRSSTGTAAGAALVVVLALSLVGTTGIRAAVVVCGLATAVVLVATIWLGIGYQPDRPATGLAGRLADSGLTERRIALWHDALTIMAEHPTGVGHGRFGSTSPTALGDRDTVYAHNEILEQGAELGWAGMVLTVLLLAWTFGRLAMHPDPDAVTVLAAVALAGLSIHACVDYVWHSPAVPLAAAALVGTGIAPSRRERRR